MFMRFLFIVSISFLLISCGSGSSKKSTSNNVATDEVLKGTLSGLIIEGLHYETQNEEGITGESGLTNSLGEFNYKSGETVTFSLGSIELFAAPADALVGFLGELASTLPQDADALLSELANLNMELNDPSFPLGQTIPNVDLLGQPTGDEVFFDPTAINGRNETKNFDRIVNIVSLLIALDTDADFTNGIQLGEAHESLNDTALNIDLPMQWFLRSPVTMEVLSEFGSQTQLDLELVIIALYQAAQINIPSERIDSILITHDGRETREFYSYDLAGRLDTFAMDIDNDGTSIDGRAELDWADDGQLSSISCLNENSTLIKRVTKTYDNRNLETESTITIQDNISRTVTDHDDFGRKTLVELFSGNSNTPFESSLNTYNPVTGQLARNDNIPGASFSFEYDEFGSLSQIGVNSIGDLNFEESVLDEYNDIGQLISRTVSAVIEDNGELVDATIFTYDYDPFLNQLTILLDDNVPNNDGDDMSRTATFNPYGQLTDVEFDADLSSNGISETTSKAYNANFLISSTTKTQFDSGTETTSVTTTFDYQTTTIENGLRNLLKPDYEALLECQSVFNR